MRTGIFFDKQVTLKERDWKKCLERVNTKKAKLKNQYSSEYRIAKACPFCTFHKRNCEKCPLDVFTPKNKASYGCVRLFNLVSQSIKAKRCLTLSNEYVSWEYDDDEDARRILKTVYNMLLKMKKKKSHNVSR